MQHLMNHPATHREPLPEPDHDPLPEKSPVPQDDPVPDHDPMKQVHAHNFAK